MLDEKSLNSKLFSITKQAYKSLKKGRNTEACLLLEDISNEVSENIYVLFLLSVSYILTEKYSKYENIINRVNRLKVDFFPFEELDAFISLKSALSKENAIVRYLKLQEIYKESRKFGYILKKIRQAEDFQLFQKEIHLSAAVTIPAPSKVYFSDKASAVTGFQPDRQSSWTDESKSSSRPGRRADRADKKERREFSLFRYLNFKYIIIFLVVLSIIPLSVILFLKLYNSTTFETVEKSRPMAEKIEFISIGDIKYSLIDKLTNTKSKEFYYSENNLKKDFKKAKILIKNENYNPAIIIINRIINSNANISVIEKAKFIHDFILNIRDRKPYDITYGKITEKPYLYKGITISWKGKLANLKKRGGKSTFNLLLDYKKNVTFDGLVGVYMDFEVDKEIKNGDQVMIYGTFINTVNGSSGGVYLQGIDLKKL